MEETGGGGHFGAPGAELMMGEGGVPGGGGGGGNPESPGNQCGIFESIGRSLRRQKNIFYFGSKKEKAMRIAFVFYLVLIHFYAFEYYLGYE